MLEMGRTQILGKAVSWVRPLKILSAEPLIGSCRSVFGGGHWRDWSCRKVFADWALGAFGASSLVDLFVHIGVWGVVSLEASPSPPAALIWLQHAMLVTCLCPVSQICGMPLVGSWWLVALGWCWLSNGRLIGGGRISALR